MKLPGVNFAAVVMAAAIVLSVCACAPRKPPDWIDKTVVAEGDSILSVGHSPPGKNKKKARTEALVNAVDEFMKHTGVKPDSFDRSIEIYSKKQGRGYLYMDDSERRVARARMFMARPIQIERHMRKPDEGYIASVLLRIPGSEYERILEEDVMGLALDFILCYEDAKGNLHLLTEKSVLTSDNAYAVYVRASNDCYLYIYHVDTSGKAFRLFPNIEYGMGFNPLPSSAGSWIPGTGEMIELDETLGKEQLYIFASLEKISGFEGSAAKNLTVKDLDLVTGAKAIAKAIPVGKRDREKVVSLRHPDQLTDVKKKLLAPDALVYRTWFTHK
jgi:hypothetical protein